MCCLSLGLLFLGPRVGIVLYWLFPVGRSQFNYAFQSLIWPILGVIFVPWTTVMWTLFSGKNGIAGFDWVWVGLGLVIDIVTYTGGFSKRKTIPGYPNAAP
ncbi:MAG: hypothetical protein A2Y88_12155 [Chloroflexi bacterium RBG_13_48_10]|nr:MAG: hypothetical protein A2Y88_12155 [Chloroflexi bacterium RBG_13_48_10]